MADEFSRNLFLTNSQNMAEYNQRVLNLLTEKDVIFLPRILSKDIIPYLNTRVGTYLGIDDITRYATELTKLREKKGLTRRSEQWDKVEPYGIIDSYNRGHFEKVTIQYAPLQLLLDNYEYQQKRAEELMGKK